MGGSFGPPAPERRSRPRAAKAGQVGTAQEHDRALSILGRAHRLLQDEFAAIRRGGQLDMPALGNVARELSQSMRRNKFALVGLTRLRNRHEYTYVHSVGVSALMIGLARELKLPEPEVEAIGLAGLLHDIGKSRVPLEVLDKPGPLSPEEWSTVMTHPERGHAILSRMPDLAPVVLDVCLHHHERMDGSGYPERLTGDQISLAARIAAICDVYDALTSKRAYKDSRPAADVLAWMNRTSGHFDAALLRSFRGLIGAFPAGTLVRLQRGRLAVVLNEPAIDAISPRVCAFHCSSLRRDLPPTICDTAGDPIVGVERPGDWGFDDWDARCETLMMPPAPPAYA